VILNESGGLQELIIAGCHHHFPILDRGVFNNFIVHFVTYHLDYLNYFGRLGLFKHLVDKINLFCLAHCDQPICLRSDECISLGGRRALAHLDLQLDDLYLLSVSLYLNPWISYVSSIVFLTPVPCVQR
jgi:hypothetical protein